MEAVETLRHLVTLLLSLSIPLFQLQAFETTAISDMMEFLGFIFHEIVFVLCGHSWLYCMNLRRRLGEAQTGRG